MKVQSWGQNWSPLNERVPKRVLVVRRDFFWISTKFGCYGKLDPLNFCEPVAQITFKKFQNKHDTPFICLRFAYALECTHTTHEFYHYFVVTRKQSFNLNVGTEPGHP